MSEMNPRDNRELVFEGPLEDLGLLHDFYQDKDENTIFPTDEGMVWLGHSVKERNRYAFVLDMEGPTRQVFDLTIFIADSRAKLTVFTAIKDGVCPPDDALDWLDFQRDTGIDIPTIPEVTQFTKIFNNYLDFLEAGAKKDA